MEQESGTWRARPSAMRHTLSWRSGDHVQKRSCLCAPAWRVSSGSNHCVSMRVASASCSSVAIPPARSESGRLPFWRGKTASMRARRAISSSSAW